MSFTPYPLNKNNPRNKLSPNVRWKQKLTLTEDTVAHLGKHGWQIYTWFLGCSANEDKMFWHPISKDDASYYKNFLQIPVVATMAEDDWTPLPHLANTDLAADQVIFARTEQYLLQRKRQEEAMYEYEKAREAYTQAGGNPHSFHRHVEAPFPPPEMEKCAFCGIHTEAPCRSLPPDMCEQALEASYPASPIFGKK